MSKIIFMFLVTWPLSICVGQPLSEKVDGNTTTVNRSFFNENKKKESAATDYIGIYQKYISGIRGHDCPMYPSCSNFGLKAFAETNFISGFVLTSDRLLRCGHDSKHYALTIRDNGVKFIDYPAYDDAPVELYYSRRSFYFAYSDTLKGDSSYLFIQKLINNQYFQEALLEIMRIEFQNHIFDIDLFINKIICLKATGDYEKALFEYETRCPSEFKNHPELAYQIALIHYKLQNYDQTIRYSSSAIASCTGEYCRAKALMLKGLSLASQYEWQKSMESYQKLMDLDNFKDVAISNYTILESAQNLKTKSPAFAGILAIVPGAGYAYTGHKQTAISSFVVNGLLAFATYSSFKKENYGMGVLTGIFGASFYIGNIYGSIKSARRYNENQRKTIINKLEFNTNL